jgi:ATP-binding cassette subfamily F protein uup
VSILSTEQLGHIYSDRWLFKDLSFGIQKGDRVALVGINGTGKSTLLKILAGIENPSLGKVVSERGINIGYLEQDPKFEGLTTINDFVFSVDNEQQQLIKEYERLIDMDPIQEEKLAEVTEKLSASNAWEYEYHIKTVLSRLGLKNLDQEIKNLSGGQQKRLALAKLLINEPDIYVLDEPTNHLDIETIEWLEKLLTTKQKTLIFVTHDRYFLNNICTEIRELERGKIYTYKGKYDNFLNIKEQREAGESVTLERNQNLLKKELEWMRRQPQARGTKSKSRIDAYYELEEKTQNKNVKESVQLSVKISRQGGKILEVNGLNKSFNDHIIIKDFSYTFKKGDRIGLAGKNGTGKSTFLNLITGILEPDQGTVVKGETTVFGYYRQLGLKLNENERVIDIVKNIAEFIKMANGDLISASQLLTHFLFPPEKQFGFVSKLSGGEKKRLQLLRVLITNPNFLILDEPSNDLDIDTLNVLEEFLENYSGVLILVSHDRYLLDRLTEQLFIFTDSPELKIYNGNYSDYKLELEFDEKIAKEKTVKTETQEVITKNPVVKNPENVITFKEKQELTALEKEIPQLEEEIQKKSDTMNTVTDHNLLIEIAQEVENLNEELSKKEERWMTLLEKEN